jgi:WD40 repeat protein
MKKSIGSVFLAFLFLTVLLSGCAPASTPVPPTLTFTPIPSTNTPVPTATPTPIKISSETVTGLQEVFRIGRGSGSDLAWLQDGSVAILYSTGLSVYSPTGKLIKSIEPENHSISTDSVMSVDRKYVASLVNYDTVLIWDANTGAIQHEFQTACPRVRESATHRIAFSHDGTWVAACDEGGVSIWDLEAQEKIKSLKIKNSAPATIMFAMGDEFLIVGSTREPESKRNNFGDLEIFDLTSEQVLASFKYQGFASAIATNQAGNLVAWPVSDLEVVVYDLQKMEVLRTVVVPSYAASVGFSPDGKTIAVSGNYYVGTSFVDLDSGKAFTRPNHLAATIIKYSPDGKYIAGGWDGYGLFSASTMSQIAWLGDFKEYSTIAFDPQGTYVAVGGSLVAFWDLRKNSLAFPNLGPWGWLFAFSPDGGYMITNDWNDQDWNHRVAVYSRSASRITSYDITESSSNSYIKPPKMCPSGQCVAFGVGGNEIKLVNLKTSKLVSNLGPHFFTDYEFSPDDSILASSGNDVTFWDYSSGEVIQTINGPTPIWDIAFSPDGSLLAGSIWRKGVYVWRTDTGELVHTFDDIKYPKLMAFSPQGDILVTLGYDFDGNNNGLAVLGAWDLNTSEFLYKILGTQAFGFPSSDFDSQAHFTFNHDGSLIAIKGFSEHIELVDAVSGTILKTLDTFKVTWADRYDSDSFAFSADDQLFAVAGEDGIVRLFNVYP